MDPTLYLRYLYLSSVISTKTHLNLQQKCDIITQRIFRNLQGWTSSSRIGYHTLKKWIPGAKITTKQTTQEKNNPDTTWIFRPTGWKVRYNQPVLKWRLWCFLQSTLTISTTNCKQWNRHSFNHFRNSCLSDHLWRFLHSTTIDTHNGNTS